MDDSGRGGSRERWRPVGLFGATVLLVLAGNLLLTELRVVGIVDLAVGLVGVLVVTLWVLPAVEMHVWCGGFRLKLAAYPPRAAGGPPVEHCSRRAPLVWKGARLRQTDRRRYSSRF